MNRQEFMRRLEYLLRSIPESERADALAYYNNYFDEAGVENEQQVIQELGSPEAVAQIILEDYRRGQQNSYEYGNYEYSGSSNTEYSSYGQTQNAYEKQGEKKSSLLKKIKNMSTTEKVLLIILLIITSPIWTGVVAGLFGIIIGLIAGLFGLVVGLGGASVGILVAGVGCLVIGAVGLMTSPVEGVVTVGIGAFLTAISSLLVLLLGLLAFKWLPILVKVIIKWGKGLINPQEGGCAI